MAECIISRRGHKGEITPPVDYGNVTITFTNYMGSTIQGATIYCNDGGTTSSNSTDSKGQCIFHVKSGRATFNVSYNQGFIDQSATDSTVVYVGIGENANGSLKLSKSYSNVYITSNRSVRFGCSTSATISCYGGGGGGYGGYSNTGSRYGSYGGGGGGYSSENISVTPGTSYRVTIGSGGRGSYVTNNDSGYEGDPVSYHTRFNGVSGGTTSFDTLLSATGGGGATVSGPGIGGIGNTMNGGNGKNTRNQNDCVSNADKYNGACGGGGVYAMFQQNSNSIYDAGYMSGVGGDGQAPFGGNGGNGGFISRYAYSAKTGNNAGGGGGGGCITAVSNHDMWWDSFYDGGNGYRGLVVIRPR